MASDPSANATLDPGFFDGRLLVEIEAWDGNLHVGLSSDGTPPEYRFQGGLNYTRGFDIQGRIAAPGAYRGRTIRIWLSPFGPDMRFGRDVMDEVGQLHDLSPSPQGRGISATLMVPETALATVATCLASVWKYLHIWTFDANADRASVRAFSFSSTVHRNLDAWVAES